MCFFHFRVCCSSILRWSPIRFFKFLTHSNDMCWILWVCCAWILSFLYRFVQKRLASGVEILTHSDDMCWILSVSCVFFPCRAIHTRISNRDTCMHLCVLPAPQRAAVLFATGIISKPFGVRGNPVFQSATHHCFWCRFVKKRLASGVEVLLCMLILAAFELATSRPMRPSWSRN